MRRQSTTSKNTWMISRTVSEVIPRLSAEIRWKNDYSGQEEPKQGLLVQVLHRRCAENDEESHPQRGTLKGDDFVGFSLFGFIIGFENHGIQEQGQEAKNEEQFDEKDSEVFRVMLNTAAGLRCQDLIDIVKVDPPGEQQHDDQDAGHFFIVLIEDVGDGLNLFLRHGLLKTRRHSHDQKREAADPNDRRQQMKPVVDDRDECIEIGKDTLQGVHRESFDLSSGLKNRCIVAEALLA
jgi:hypothetical protein